MYKFFKLVKWEFLIQNRIYNFTKSHFAFFSFGTICIALVSNYENINNYGIIFTIIYLPIILLSFSNTILKADLEDGCIETMLASFTSLQIIIAKFIAFYTNAIRSCLITLPVIFLAFNPSLKLLAQLFLIQILEVLLTCALVILVAAIQSYFRNNTNFLPQLLMILMVPTIILSGLIIQNTTHNYLIFILVGINMIIVPIIIGFASYLIKNLFNLSS